MFLWSCVCWNLWFFSRAGTKCHRKSLLKLWKFTTETLHIPQQVTKKYIARNVSCGRDSLKAGKCPWETMNDIEDLPWTSRLWNVILRIENSSTKVRRSIRNSTVRFWSAWRKQFCETNRIYGAANNYILHNHNALYHQTLLVHPPKETVYCFRPFSVLQILQVQISSLDYDENATDRSRLNTVGEI